jgi:hypothetical protein
MSEDAEQQPYAGPGRETKRRREMPDDYDEVKEFVEKVDADVPDEHLETRVKETFEDRADESKD